MASLAQNVLSNAAWAGILALVAALASQVWRHRPGLVHGLWLLVLLKLVTPSLVGVSFLAPSSTKSAEPQRVLPIVAVTPLEAPALDIPSKAAGTQTPIAATPPQAKIAEVPPLRREPPISPPALPTPEPRRPIPWGGILGVVWLAGVLAWSTAVVLDASRFRRILASASPAPEALCTRVAALADQVGLRRGPSVWTVPARIPPMLWALVGPPRLLLPDALWHHLDEDQRDAVLVHELAHLKRRDHWVRRLEAVVLGLYWWNPIAWWARREIEKAEEECCDAWVVWTLPRSAEAYAEALLATATFLSGPRTAWPIGATGAGHVPPLKKRLIMILRDHPSGSILRPVSRMTFILGALTLLLLPGWAPGEAPAQPKADDGPQKTTQAKPAPASTETAPPKAKPEKSPAPDKSSETPPALAGDKPNELPIIKVHHPFVYETCDYLPFSGWVEANEKAEIHAEVGGRLEKVHFKGGSTVKKGDVLFEIDPKPYQIELDKADAEILRTAARLKRATQDLKRYTQHFRRNAVAESEVEHAENDLADAQADFKEAQANRELAAMKLASTKVTAPINGKISRALLVPGSIVAAHVSPLATIISLEEMSIIFNMDSSNFQRLYQQKDPQQASGQGRREFPAVINVPATSKPRIRGLVNLEDYEINPGAGNYRLRVAISNTDQSLLPGMQASVLVVTSDPYRAPFISQVIGLVDGMNEAEIGVVNEKNVVEARKIKVKLLPNRMALIVTEGLTPKDWVVATQSEVKTHGSSMIGMAVQPLEIPTPGIPNLFNPMAEEPKSGEAKP